MTSFCSSEPEIWKEGNGLFLGITGGIASGKSTVARMLAQKGAVTIDFDGLSRVVVEPEKPAWKKIVAEFGEQILRKDRTLDRKKLSEIVFRDPAQRKRLESFVHPRIYDEFIRRAEEYTARDPRVIIQVIVPLLFEANLKHLFHKVLLVYIPEEMQVERLIQRDALARGAALQILHCQWPIGQKRDLADFIVDNSGSLGETERQVQEIWHKIKAQQSMD